MTKLRKFVSSSWCKLLQQIVIMGLALVVAGCAAVQNPAALGNPAAIVGVHVSAQEIEAGIQQVLDDPYNNFILTKPGTGYVVSWMNSQGMRLFAMATKTSDSNRFWGTCLAAGCWRSAGVERTFIQDSWNQIPADQVKQIVPTLLGILAKTPGLVTVWVMPMGADGNWMKPWQQVLVAQ